MDRRTFSTAAMGLLSTGLLMPLTAVHASGVTGGDVPDPAAPSPPWTDARTNLKDRGGKTQEQNMKAPGVGKNQEQASKSPTSGKAMESKSKSSMPDTKVRTDKTGTGATYWPAEAERKRILALEHIAARRFG